MPWCLTYHLLSESKMLKFFAALASLHTIFLREHNRIVDELKKKGGRVSEEDMFQQARRINIAKWQHIVYSEWLPIIIGENFAKKSRLRPHKWSYFSRYSIRTDPRIFSNFAGAAFRFGHSMVLGDIPTHDENGNKRSRDFVDIFNNPRDLMRENFVGDLARGYTKAM